MTSRESQRSSYGMKKTALAVFALAALAAAAHANAAEPPVNAVQDEMRSLDGAFKNLVGAVVLDDPASIEGLFIEVQRKRVKTEDALEKGAVRLPKNPDKMKLFVEMDEKFHAGLEKLIEASKKGDMKKVREQTHRLLDSCVRCHEKFRK